MALNVKLPQDCETVIRNFIISKVESAFVDGVVVGLSGGLDSAVVLKLCSDALGAERVTAILLPENKSIDENFNDAENFAKSLGVRYFVSEIESVLEVIKQSSSGKKSSDSALANLKSRIRSVYLYYHANKENLLVAGTSNKSELMTGYFTKYGDSNSDIAPIGDLYKTQVRLLAEKIGIPDHFISKIPTAGLLPGQTDEKELGMPYALLDRILLGLELQVSFESLANTLDLPISEIERINNLSFDNRHKRKFTKIPKLGIRTVGTDLRE